MKPLAVVFLIAGSTYGQYFIETYAGRLGPATGDAATQAVINAEGLTLGPTGNLLYYSGTQLIEIGPDGLIGQVLGPNDFRFDLADGGDRAYYIWAAANDTAGNLYLLDAVYWRILRIDPGGTMTAFSPAQPNSGQGGLQIAPAPDGSIYLSGTDSVLYKIDPATGTNLAVAGNGSLELSPAPDGLPATSVPVQASGVAVTANGAMFFADGPLIRQVDERGLLTTVADISAYVFFASNPGPLVAAPDGTLLYRSSSRVFRIDPATGTVSPFAGGEALYSGAFRIPLAEDGLLQDSNGIVYTSEPFQINTVDNASATITPCAGTGLAVSGGDPAPATTVQLDELQGLERMAAGPDGTLYISEASSQRIRVVDPNSMLSWTVPAYTDDPFVFFSTSLAVDGQGNVFYNDTCAVLQLNPATGITATIAGSATLCGDATDGVAALTNQFQMINAIATDPAGNLYIADSSLWRVDAATGLTAKVIDGQTLDPFFPSPGGGDVNDLVHMAVDRGGNIYLNHGLGGGIVKITPDGVPSLFAGDLGFLYDSSWTSASLAVSDMAIGLDGALYISLGGTVNRVDLDTAAITAIAGSTDISVPLEGGDSGPALSARITANSLAIGGGSIFIADHWLLRRLYVPPPAPPSHTLQ